MSELFTRMYEIDIKGGRPSIARERLLRAMLLQVLYSVRSERQLLCDPFRSAVDQFSLYSPLIVSAKALS